MISNDDVAASSVTRDARSESAATKTVVVVPVGAIAIAGEVEAAIAIDSLKATTDPSRIVSMIAFGVDVAIGGVDVASRDSRSRESLVSIDVGAKLDISVAVLVSRITARRGVSGFESRVDLDSACTKKNDPPTITMPAVAIDTNRARIC